MGHKGNIKKATKGFEPSFRLAGISGFSSLLGAEFEKKLPPEAGTPLSDIGQTTGKFVAPSATIGGFSIIQKQLNQIDKNLKKKK